MKEGENGKLFMCNKLFSINFTFVLVVLSNVAIYFHIILHRVEKFCTVMAGFPVYYSINS